MITVIIVSNFLGKSGKLKNLNMLRTVTIIIMMTFAMNINSSAIKDNSNSTAPSKNGSAMLDRNASHLYKSSIDYLNKRTPIELTYSEDSKRYIDQYIVDNPEQFARIMGRAEYYFPLFDEKLANNNLPLELKNIAIIESALNPLAVSRSGAVGLWQFLFHTSKMFDLRIDSYIDERRDPEKSTEAACEYLKYLYRIFNDWQLAITAYNGGPGMIEMAIEKSGGKTNYWELRPYLTIEARNYYPKFVAACYASRFYNRHDIEVEHLPYKFHEVGTVSVKQPVWFKQVVGAIDITVEELRELNPSFKQNYIPVYGKPASLALPKSLVKEFQRKENTIYALEVVSKDYNDLRAEVGMHTSDSEPLIHYVERGEYFHKIAMQYNCTIYDIMEWNGMKSKSISAGQALRIFTNLNAANTDLVPKLKFVDLHETATNKSEYTNSYLQYIPENTNLISQVKE